MKPFIALAASTPFLLLAGVGHAATFTFSDPNCSGFTMTNGVVMCASTTEPAPLPSEPAPLPSEPAPAPSEPAPAPVGTASACSSTYQVPAGTTIIDIGAKDSYANKDFNGVFDSLGSVFDSAVGANQTKALKFTNTRHPAGFITGTAGNFGGGYKNWSLSVCPGDFSSSLPAGCLVTRRLGVNLVYSTDGSQGCAIPANTPVYLNIRSYTSGTSAGFVLQNGIF